jgi:hypothetical protein
MKKQIIINSLILFSLSIVLGTVTSCNRKGCTDTIAENYSSKSKKDDGTCVYATEKFVGTYNVTRNCGGATETFSMTVSKSSSNKTQIIISNFGNSGDNMTAAVSESGITFNQQLSGISVSGSGSISGNNLTINYTASNGTQSGSCSMSCIKI